MVSATNIDSFGNEFWIAFPGNTSNGANIVTVYVVASGPAKVTVDFATGGFSQTHEFLLADIMAGNTVFEFNLPVSADIQNNDVVESRSVHITSAPTTVAGLGPDPFKVYGFSNFVETADAYLGLPIDALGPDYIVSSYNAFAGNTIGGSQFVVVATVANTIVKIKPTAAIGGHAANVEYDVPLPNVGDTYLGRAATGLADLTGTTITTVGASVAGPPLGEEFFAVFSGNRCGNVPLGFGACDMILEQLPPTRAWGESFVTVPHAFRGAAGDTFRITAAKNGTFFSINGGVAIGLAAGQTFETTLTTPSTIVSNSGFPLLVMQYENGAFFGGFNNQADPSMMVLYPTEQYQTGYTIALPEGTPFTSINFVNLAVPTFVADGDVYLDNAPLTAALCGPLPSAALPCLVAPWAPVAVSGFKVVQVQMPNPPKPHDFTLNTPVLHPFGVWVYGNAPFSTYSYPGGMALAPIAAVDHLEVDVQGGTEQINTPFTVLARAEDVGGNGVVGVRIDFVATGILPLDPSDDFEASAISDGAGEALFTYTRTVVQTDPVMASVGSKSDSNVVIWTDIPTTTTASLTKTVDKPTALPGETLVYTINYQNTGLIDATNVVFTDTMSLKTTFVSATGGGTETAPGSGIVTWNLGTVAAGASGSLTLTVILDAEFPVGTTIVANTVVATATELTTPLLSTATTTVTTTASLAVDKVLTNNADEDTSSTVSLNDTLTYTITATNTGTATLTNVVVADALITPTGGTTPCASLAPAGTCTLVGTYVVTQANVDAGQILNTGTADSDETAPVSDPNTVPVPQNPALTVVKVADKATVSVVGEVITYTITVTNTGNVSLTGVVLTDVFTGGATLTSGDLNTNSILETTEVWTYTATYAVLQADLNAGTDLVNVATVDTAQTTPQQDDATTTITQNPSLTIGKVADKATVSVAGEVITYTITVTNTGNVDLTGVTLTDVFTGGATLTSGDLNTNSILETTEVWTYTATYTVLQSDLNAGTDLVNVATVNTVQTLPEAADATTTITQTASLTIGKVADKATVSEVGEVITYTITVTNTGNVDLTGVTLTDVFTGGATLTSGDLNTNSILETTEVWTYTATYTVLQADLNAGTALLNVATVDTAQTTPQQDDATTTITQNPSLTIGKVADKGTVSVVGEVITYTITVTNTGNVDLTGVTLTDVFAGGATLTSGDLNTNSILETTEVWTYTATYTVLQADLNAGTNLVNVATVDTAQTSPKAAQAITTITQNPSLTIVKTGALDLGGDGVATPGDVITYAFTVTNTGDVTLTGVTVTDPLVAVSGGPIPSLAPGAVDSRDVHGELHGDAGGRECRAGDEPGAGDGDLHRPGHRPAADDGPVGQRCDDGGRPDGDAGAADAGDRVGQDGGEHYAGGRGGLAGRRDHLRVHGDQYGRRDVDGGDGDRPAGGGERGPDSESGAGGGG